MKTAKWLGLTLFVLAPLLAAVAYFIEGEPTIPPTPSTPFITVGWHPVSYQEKSDFTAHDFQAEGWWFDCLNCFGGAITPIAPQLESRMFAGPKIIGGRLDFSDKNVGAWPEWGDLPRNPIIYFWLDQGVPLPVIDYALQMISEDNISPFGAIEFEDCGYGWDCAVTWYAGGLGPLGYDVYMKGDCWPGPRQP